MGHGLPWQLFLPSAGPSLVHFSINYYRHKVRLVCQVVAYLVIVLLSREGVVQGNPVVMTLCGVALLPLTEHLHA